MFRKIILLVPFISCAVNAAPTIGQIANNLASVGDFVVLFMWVACVAVGVSLIVVAFTQFQMHRMNPKLVPLLNPVLYLILGLFAIAVPFGDRILGVMDSYSVSKPK